MTAAPDSLLQKWKLLGAIAADRRLPPAAAAVAFWSLEYHGLRGMCLSVDTLKDAAGIDRRTVQRATSALVAAGYFREAHPGGRKGGKGHSRTFAPNFDAGSAYHAEAKERIRERAAAPPPFDETAAAVPPFEAERAAILTAKGGEVDRKGRQPCRPIPLVDIPPVENPLGEGAAAPPPKRAGRGSRLSLTDLPDDWAIWAHEQGHPSPARAWERFRDHWSAAPGQKGVKADWAATWRNWIRKDLEQQPRGEAQAAARDRLLAEMDPAGRQRGGRIDRMAAVDEVFSAIRAARGEDR